MGHVATVSGAVGGIGTSTLAYALALQPSTVVALIDAQSDGAPLDILIGSEGVPGARWSQVRVQSEAIDADTILDALPEHAGIHVLSSDRAGTSDARALRFLVGALRDHCDLVVLDIPSRDTGLDALQPDLRVMLLPPTVAALGSALAAPSTDLIVVADIGRADFPIGATGDYLGGEVAGVVRWQRAVTMAAAQCVPPPASSDVMKVAAGIWGRLRDGV